ncbi:hypothetical protein [Variovorax sp. J31P207]|uniref:hypothetical protein n=1 Tax=Variovorax sp. J31P207 TaxID=3053510 RepID=UPI002576DE42|nr:hypothetical protein [Variovorax sp. J31P207]MDM0072667.1 hypothetical protein [Variovorax sp. J31P207]
MRRRQFSFLAAGSVLGATGMSALAQDYPAKSIRAIVTYSPGGGTDLVGRLVFQKLGEALGQPIYVENKVGGGRVDFGSRVRSVRQHDA